MVEASPPEEQDRTPSAAARPLTSATPRQEKLSDVDIQWLYDSAVVGITRYRCLIRHRQCGAEQYQGFDTLVFPEATPFVLHQARRTSVVEPASVLFLRKDEIYRTAHPYGCGDHGTALVIHPRVLEEVAQGLGATDFASIPLTTWPLPPKAQLRLTGLLHFLEGSPGTPEPLGVEERSLALAAEIAVVPFRLIGRKTKATRRARDLAEDVKDLIVRHLPHRMSLPEMAAQLETSPFTLCRAFKRQTGLTISGYACRLRLREALRRIAEREEGLKQLAVDVGFSDHSHLTLRFRQVFGLTPTQVREALRRRPLGDQLAMLDARLGTKRPGSRVPLARGG